MPFLFFRTVLPSSMYSFSGPPAEYRDENAGSFVVIDRIIPDGMSFGCSAIEECALEYEVLLHYSDRRTVPDVSGSSPHAS
jgi:hypothetical protein